MPGLLQRHQLHVFAITFFALVSLNATREAWFMVKHIIHDKYGFSTPFLGLADTLFLLSYTAGFLVCGKLGEYMQVTRIAGLGLTGMSVLYLVTAVVFWLGAMEQPLYASLLLAQGPFQSAILLGGVAIMFNWFPPETRGTVMGVWGVSFSVGDILGEALAGIMAEELHLEWEWIVISTSGIVLLAAALLFIFITDFPHSIDVTDVDTLAAPLMLRDVAAHKEDPDEYEREEHVPHLSWSQVLSLPGVLPCSLSYAGLKMLNFGFMMWLPYFFEDPPFSMNVEEAGIAQSFYDFGSIAGCIVCGYLSDKVEKRVSVLVGMFVTVLPAIALMPVIEDPFWFYFLVPVLGAVSCGGSNLMLTAVIADLSQDKSHMESKTSVIGVMSSIATFGAAIGQVIVGELILFGWVWVFAWFFCIAVLATAVLLPLILERPHQD